MTNTTWNPIDVPLDDSAVWHMLSSGCSGNTFQLTSASGQAYCSIIAPENIHELADLVALIRPGCTQTKIDNVNVPRVYANRKRFNEEFKYDHPALEPILKNTHGLNIYQEGSMEIGRGIADFTGGDAYKYIVKGIGKKKADVIAKAKEMFIEGANKKHGLNKEEAEQIFESIERSARYQFNASHAYGYSLCNYYLGAYPKAHFTKEFYCVELDFCHSNQQGTEHENLATCIQEAQKVGLEVIKPDIRYFNKTFKILNGKLLYGLNKVRNVSNSTIDKLQKSYPNLWNMSFDEIVLGPLHLISSKQGEMLIKGGAFDWVDLPRSYMLHYHGIINGKDTSLKFNDLKRHYIKESRKSIEVALQYAIDNPNQTIEFEDKHKKVLHSSVSLAGCKRILFQLQNPHRKPVDTIRKLINYEVESLGKEFTYTKLDMSDCPMGDCTCKELQMRQIYVKQQTSISIIIKDTRIYKSFVDGEDMCYVQGYDLTCPFPSFKIESDLYKECQDLIVIGEPIKLYGSIFINKYGQQTFNVSEVEEI